LDCFHTYLLDEFIPSWCRATLSFKASTEESVAEGWAAVASALVARMTELSMSQRELIDRSRVSKAIVGEIQNNTIQRDRGDRTLSALSEALNWHPDHLAAVLNGHPIPRVGDPVVHSEKDVPDRLTAIEHQLRRMNDRLDDVWDAVQRKDR
jgi:hypothetical protein